MRTIFYFIITCLISTGTLFAALNAKNPLPGYAVAFGLWAFFLWGYNKRSRKKAEKRHRKKLFEQYMRSRFGDRN